MADSKEFYAEALESILAVYEDLTEYWLEPRTPSQSEQVKNLDALILELKDFASELKHLSNVRRGAGNVKQAIENNKEQFGSSLGQAHLHRADSIEEFLNHREARILGPACTKAAIGLIYISEILEWSLANINSQ